MGDTEALRRMKAQNLRYRKPIVKNLNLSSIKETLWEIQEQCEEVHWYFDSNDDTLINALDGNEDEAYEFRMMFGDLCAECEQMLEDLHNEWVPECFDALFVASDGGKFYDGLLGYDEFEQDYFGISCSDAFAEDEAKKVLMKLTKDNLVAAMRQCFRIYASYIALQHRYDCLKASMDILRSENTGYLQMVKQINNLYENLECDSIFKVNATAEIEYDRFLKNLPQDAWLQ